MSTGGGASAAGASTQVRSQKRGFQSFTAAFPNRQFVKTAVEDWLTRGRVPVPDSAETRPVLVRSERQALEQVWALRRLAEAASCSQSACRPKTCTPRQWRNRRRHRWSHRPGGCPIPSPTFRWLRLLRCPG